MDNNGILLSTTTATTVFGVVLMVYRSVNGKRCRSRCCGYNFDADFKVDDAPPTPPNTFQVNNPITVAVPPP